MKKTSRFSFLTCLISFLLPFIIKCESTAAVCSGGTSIGAFIFLQPNRSTTGVVGTPMTLKWKFTPLVKIIPSSIDIWMANVDPTGNGYSFTIPVLKGVNGSSANSTQWVVSANNDGQYMMRIGISGRDPLLNATGACLQNGEAYGASSATFKIVNAVAFPKPAQDRFGPIVSKAIPVVFDFNYPIPFLILQLLML
jgi:hypothetical protein